MANLNIRRKSGFIVRSGGRRRETRWLSAIPVLSSLNSDGAVITTTLSSVGLALRPFTVVRTRGLLYLSSDQIAASEDQYCAYGETVVSEQAATAGIASVPTPIVEPESDWHVYETLMSDFRFGTGIGFVSPGGMERVFDSKAMRKVDVGEQLVAVVEAGAGAVSDGITVRSFTRVLIKLH